MAFGIGRRLKRWRRNLYQAGAKAMRRKETSHVIILGTGRAGTTLLMRICTRLGLDTGFTVADLDAVENNIGRAGLEFSLHHPDRDRPPEIIKGPNLADDLRRPLEAGQLVIDSAIVPVRNLDQAAASRVAVHIRALSQGMDPACAPGGLWGTSAAEDQRHALSQKFYETFEFLAENRIPVTLVSFPRFAQDADYFVATLGPFFKRRFRVSPARLRVAHLAEVKTEYIGDHQ